MSEMIDGWTAQRIKDFWISQPPSELKVDIQILLDQNAALTSRIEKLEKSLDEIASMGDGIKPEWIDWANIGRNAKYIAQETLSQVRGEKYQEQEPAMVDESDMAP